MRRLVGGAVLTALVVGGLAGVASGAGSMVPAGGVIDIYASPITANGGVSRIVIIGAIGDYGTATSINKDGKVNATGNYVKIRLKKGTFEVNSVALNKKVNSAPPTVVNKATCSYGFAGSGPVTVFNGTGAYAGISGTLQITETFAGIGPPYKTGAKKGECNLSNNAQPVSIWGSITGKGTIKF
jgi:hypothetical protein